MRFSVSNGDSISTADVDQETAARQDLDHLVNKLRDYYPDIVDDDLRADAGRFLTVAIAAEDVGPDHVENTLSQLKDEWPMRRERGKDVDECFPTECLEHCHHAQQGACPMLTDLDTQRRRRRARERNDDPDAYLRDMRDLLSEVGCHVGLQALDRVEDEHAPLVRYGQLLLIRVESRVLHGNDDEAARKQLAQLSLATMVEESDIDADAADLSIDAGDGDAAPDADTDSDEELPEVPGSDDQPPEAPADTVPDPDDPVPGGDD